MKQHIVKFIYDDDCLSKKGKSGGSEAHQETENDRTGHKSWMVLIKKNN